MSEEKGKAAEKPAPASVVLPLTFSNSFWSQDYRTGFEALYQALEAGCGQSDELVAAIRKRASAEREFGHSLHPSALRPDGFAIDEGASLKMGLEALLTSAVQEARAHAQLADELEKSIAGPFQEWSDAHKGRIKSSRSLVEAHLASYEKKLAEVAKLKALYDDACRQADTAEDELSFSKVAQRSPPAARGPPPPAAPPAAAPGETTSLALSDTATLSAAHGKEKNDSVLPATPPTVPSKAGSASDSDDGSDVLESDDKMISRSGATGGSITAALGRAFTTRRKALVKAASPTSPTNLEGQPMSTERQDLERALDVAKSTFSSLYEKVAGPQSGEAKNDEARKRAEATEEKYKTGVEVLDNLRLTLEETLSEHFSYTHRCEQDRLKAATSVLRSFHTTLLSLSARVGAQERVVNALQLIRPERDVLAIVERLRTGPFQPRPTSYHSHYSEPSIHAFGIDLRKFDETNTSPNKVPPILTFLLDYISDKYKTVSAEEQRKAWLYETPLAAQHHLRSALNKGKLDRATLDRYDLPVVVSTVKLWLLELDVPVVIYSHYDEYRALYPKRVGAEIDDIPTKLIASHVARLPPVHLEVLRTLVDHFYRLINSTKTEESDDVYMQKLALSVARCIVRPKVETSLTLDDRFPALLFTDLVRSFNDIFSNADELKTKQREDRYKPRRQRTKPVDVRPTRRNLGVSTSGSVDLTRAETVLKERGSLSSAPPVPPIPSLPAPTAAKSDLSTSPEPTSPDTVAPPTVAYAEAEAPPPVSVDPPTVAPAAEQADGTPASTMSPSTSLSRTKRAVRGPRPLPGAGAEPSVDNPFA